MVNNIEKKLKELRFKQEMLKLQEERAEKKSQQLQEFKALKKDIKKREFSLSPFGKAVGETKKATFKIGRLVGGGLSTIGRGVVSLGRGVREAQLRPIIRPKVTTRLPTRLPKKTLRRLLRLQKMQKNQRIQLMKTGRLPDVRTKNLPRRPLRDEFLENPYPINEGEDPLDFIMRI